MSTAAKAATAIVRRMTEIESHGWGDNDNALTRIGSKSGIPFWTLKNLYRGRATTVEVGVFQSIRNAYLEMCERQIAKLQHEIATQKIMGGSDDLQDFEREAAALAARLAERKVTR